MALPMHVADEQEVRIGTRRRTEGLVNCAAYLELSDRALVESVFERGMSVAALARAVGDDPRHLRRRLKRLLNRISSREFQFVLRARRHWSDNQQRVADAVILRGRTQRQAASELNLSLHQVRTYLHAVHVLMRAQVDAHASRHDN